MLHTECLKCGRALKNSRSMQMGYGPVCAGKTGKRSRGDDGDLFLETITEPFAGDVVLKRDGDDTTGEVTVNIPHSVVWHSPTGFNWSYHGSGPADLALNILNAFVPPGSDGEAPVVCYRGECSATASQLHQRFKHEFIAPMPVEGGRIEGPRIREWIKKQFS